MLTACVTRTAIVGMCPCSGDIPLAGRRAQSAHNGRNQRAAVCRKEKGSIYRMLTKQELGRRLRIARFERNLTLKEVASRCGMSATHISEVERGKTSPTIGALQRIAGALGERTSYFVRDENLPEVSMTRKQDRNELYVTDSKGQAHAAELVTRGIPRGYMQVLNKRSPAGSVSAGRAMVAEAVFICVQGSTRITVGEESHVLREGDTLQARLDDGYSAENIGEGENEVLLVLASPVLMQF